MRWRGKWRGLKFWEPEESVGTLWDRAAANFDATPHFPAAVVALSAVRAPLGVLFRGLGGAAGVEIKANAEQEFSHRRNWLGRLAREVEKRACARFDGETLFLPAEIDAFPEASLNRDAFLWLAALAACAEPVDPEPADGLQRDILRLRRAAREADAALDKFPGLRPLREKLYRATLLSRPELRRPAVEAEIEDWIRARLADVKTSPSTLVGRALDGDDEALKSQVAPKDYRPPTPVLLWGERAPRPGGGRRQEAPDETPEPGASDGDERVRKAQRRASDRAERKDSLILHRFEALLSFGDFLNVNRDVDDDDEDNARKAAQDAQQLDLAQHWRKPKTRLRFDLDLAPEDADREKLAGKFLYPEWDWRRGLLAPERTRVLENIAPAAAQGLVLDGAARRRIKAVRRQFEALRPQRKILPRQSDGFEIDLDAFVRARVDRRANGELNGAIYRDARPQQRDLAVAVLFDASRSTESAIEGRPMIAIAREALVALAHGLSACGDRVALYAFSSLRRDRVFVDVCKDFGEPLGPEVEARIAALKPGFYTRLGAAIRHASFRLGQQPEQRRLLLILTDGKPNDLDHYEGRFGAEDVRRAVMEARRRGQAVFCVAVDAATRAQLPHMFGPAGFAVISRPEKLTATLPMIYRHLVGGA